MTGYLTQRERVNTKRYKLTIPNLAIRDIFQTQIMEYFKESVKKKDHHIYDDLKLLFQDSVLLHSDMHIAFFLIFP